MAGPVRPAGLAPGSGDHSINLPGNYHLVVQPLRELRERLAEAVAGARETYGDAAFRAAEGELLLAEFWSREDMEATLLRWLHRIIGQQESFGILLNNFGSKPGLPLYIRVQDPEPFQPLVAALRPLEVLMRTLYGPAGKGDGPPLRLVRHPRLPLLESIRPEAELLVLLDFSCRSFRAEMEVEELLLYRTDPGGGRQLVSRLRLLPSGLKRNPFSHYND